jgi:hypothetical protein
MHSLFFFLSFIHFTRLGPFLQLHDMADALFASQRLLLTERGGSLLVVNPGKQLRAGRAGP